MITIGTGIDIVSQCSHKMKHVTTLTDNSNPGTPDIVIACRPKGDTWEIAEWETLKRLL